MITIKFNNPSIWTVDCVNSTENVTTCNLIFTKPDFTYITVPASKIAGTNKIRATLSGANTNALGEWSMCPELFVNYDDNPVDGEKEEKFVVVPRRRTA